MAEAQSTGQKTCTVCGIDVSGKPRVKDAQGRYMCQDCFNKARAARGAQTAPKVAAAATKPSTPAPDDSDNSFLLDMGKKGSVSEKGVVPCPECGRALEEGTVVCVGCGYNSKTGKRLQVKVLKPEVDKTSGAKVTSPGSSLASNPHVIAVSTLTGFAAFAGVSIAVPEIHGPYMLCAIAFWGIVRLWIAITAWQDAWYHGWLCLKIPLYPMFWVGFMGDSTLQKWFGFTAWVPAILGLILDPSILDAI